MPFEALLDLPRLSLLRPQPGRQLPLLHLSALLHARHLNDETFLLFAMRLGVAKARAIQKRGHSFPLCDRPGMQHYFKGVLYLLKSHLSQTPRPRQSIYR